MDVLFVMLQLAVGDPKSAGTEDGPKIWVVVRKIAMSASHSQRSREIRRGVRVRIAIGTEEDGSSLNPMEECADDLLIKFELWVTSW